MKIFLLISSLIICCLTYGQRFDVTPEGLKDTKDYTKTYLVVPVEGKTAKQLYDNTLKYINKNYKNPDDVIKGKNEGEYIRFITHVPSFVYVKNSGVKVVFDANYSSELTFKDGKVKYEVFELDIYNPNNSLPLTFMGGGMDWCVYNKKGELKREEVKLQIEDYFTSELNKITEALKGTESDNW